MPSAGSEDTAASISPIPPYNTISIRMPPILSESQPPTGRKKLPAIMQMVAKSAAATGLNLYCVLKKIVK
ncbi:hypothetical protein D3C73_1585480 [compost metagenome]